jgi:hypothetical protein
MFLSGYGFGLVMEKIKCYVDMRRRGRCKAKADEARMESRRLGAWLHPGSAWMRWRRVWE